MGEVITAKDLSFFCFVMTTPEIVSTSLRTWNGDFSKTFFSIVDPRPWVDSFLTFPPTIVFQKSSFLIYKDQNELIGSHLAAPERQNFGVIVMITQQISINYSLPREATKNQECQLIIASIGSEIRRTGINSSSQRQRHTPKIFYWHKELKFFLCTDGFKASDLPKKNGPAQLFKKSVFLLDSSLAPSNVITKN